MFFFFAVTSDTRELGRRKCRYFPCCGVTDAMAVVTCASQRFIFFFIPLFRFGKRYFISCPNCGSVYEIARDEGKRLERDPSAEVNPEKIHRLAGGRAAHYCPHCGAPVEPGNLFCPHCGQKL